ncbi:MAG: hypothetical protein V1727_03195 [Candidatus Omnitrophota bacterium]
MDRRNILIVHISNISGHRGASIAIEKALREINAPAQIQSINGFGYTNPRAERVINALYMLVIQKIPAFWEYLYDNERVLERLKKTRTWIHKRQENKIARLLEEYAPDIVVCTQAFPCGMIADYKCRHNLRIPLMAVLTDYAPHGYWLHQGIDIYVVPSEEVKSRFIQRGIAPDCLMPIGIPVSPEFLQHHQRPETFRRYNLAPEIPVALVMGGGQGLGPIKEVTGQLNRVSSPLQIAVVCGTNKRLFLWLKKRQRLFSKLTVVIGQTDNNVISELMDIAAFIVTKPGGLTTAEALSKSLPMIIIDPLPGQEKFNTRFLLEGKAALKVNTPRELGSLAEKLLKYPRALQELRMRAKNLACPDSALKIARLILQTMQRYNKN